MTVQQVLIEASREGTGEAALPGATAESVDDIVQKFAADSGTPVKRDGISAIPDPALAFDNQRITVSVTVAVSHVSWISGHFLSARLKGIATMRSESLE